MNNDVTNHDIEVVDRRMAALRDAPIPPGPSQELIDASLNTIHCQPAEHSRWFRTWMSSPMRIAAVLLLGLMLVAAIILIRQGKSQGLALAAAIEKAQQTRSVSFEVHNQSPNQKLRCIIREPDWALVEIFSEQGELQGTSVINLRTGLSTTIDHAKKYTTIMRMQTQIFNLYEWLATAAKGKEKRIGQKQLAGREAVGFEVMLPSNAPSYFPGRSSIVWVDIDSQLPLRIETSLPSGQPETIDNIRFNLPESEIADARFDLKIPQGYKLQDMGGILQNDLQAPPTTQQATELLTLKPRIGIGELKFGDSRARAIEIFGPPEGGNEIDLQYPSKGIALLVHPKTGLLNIVVHSTKAVYPFVVNDFKGATEQGITMSATRKQIEAAYGKPDGVNGQRNQLFLTYDANHLNFFLLDGELVRILMTNPNPRKSTTTQP